MKCRSRGHGFREHISAHSGGFLFLEGDDTFRLPEAKHGESGRLKALLTRNFMDGDAIKESRGVNLEDGRARGTLAAAQPAICESGLSPYRPTTRC